MNRRAFLSTLTKAAACFTILPSANRIWKATAVVQTPRVHWTADEADQYLQAAYDMVRLHDAVIFKPERHPLVFTFYDSNPTDIIQIDQQLPRARTLHTPFCSPV